MTTQDGAYLTFDFTVNSTNQVPVTYAISFVETSIDNTHSDMPTDAELLSMLSLKLLDDGSTRLVFDSAQQNFAFLGINDALGIKYRITATDAYGNQTTHDFGISIDGIDEGITGRQTVTEANNPVIADESPFRIYSLTVAGSRQRVQIKRSPLLFQRPICTPIWRCICIQRQ